MGPGGFDPAALVPSADSGDGDGSAHFVQFYDKDAFLIDSMSRYVGTALGAGDAAIVIATKARRTLLAERLRTLGLDVATVREQGRYLSLDAGETLSQIMVDGWPDEDRFAAVVGRAIAHAGAGAHRPRVRAFGEMVALLCADGRPDAAIRLEELWNDLGRKMPFFLFCAYPMSAFRAEGHDEHLLKVCTQHGHVIPTESYSSLTTRDERLRVIVQLQQKAGALEVETAQRRHAEASLQRQEEALADFLENAVEGLHRLGPDGRILWANRALIELLGYDTDEYVGQHASGFFVERAVFTEFWRKLMRRETLYDYPAGLRCKDGSIKHVLIHSNGFWEDGKFLHTRCFVRDVTEQKRLELELKNRLEQLADVDRRKDEFLAMLSHELRNPLSAVRNAVVAARLDPSRRDRALDIARRQADQLGRLIDDLLDVARITHGRISLRRRPVGLTGIVNRALETTRSLLEERGHTLTLALPDDDLRIDADPTRLEQVIVNLLTNAAKYTESGGQIEVAAERQGDEVRIRVRDNGMGIAPEMLPRVFELFAQANRSLDRTQGGLGVGLTIVRRLVELHGGRVDVRSEVGEGSEFRLWLPALPPAAQETPPPSAQTVQPGTRVLLVEDNPDAAESLTMLLELLGHRVEVAYDGLAALEAARRVPPDVMLIDIGLPGMDGYDVARRAREEPALGRTVLVALTGYGREEDKERAMAAGFDRHLVKPVDPNTLQDLVLRIGRSGPALH